MIKLHSFLLSGLVISSHLMGASADHSIYYQELKDLKKRPETKILLDSKNAHQGLRSIQADILECKSSSLFQRFSRAFASVGLLQNGVIAFNFFVVTPETMPKLHGYIEGVCQRVGIAVPAIYITRSDWIPNAFALKLFMSAGIVVISRKFVQELSAEALEGIITHELGHIKYNHTNKIMAVTFLSNIVLDAAFNDSFSKKSIVSPVLVGISYKFARWSLPKLIIGKRFEKQADAFAFEQGKAKCLMDSMKYMECREQIREDEFSMTRDLLKQNENELFMVDYYRLMGYYWIARGLHKGRQGLEWVLHHTFLDPHPCPEERIAAAEKYLDQQEA